MADVDSLFTGASLLTLQGSSAGALLVPNGLGLLIGDSFDKYKKWAAFGVAMVLSYAAAALASDADATKWLIAFFNGFLIFASAMGINQLPAKNRPGSTRYADANDPKFFKSWV